jgi:hypothetical protein
VAEELDTIQVRVHVHVGRRCIESLGARPESNNRLDRLDCRWYVLGVVWVQKDLNRCFIVTRKKQQRVAEAKWDHNETVIHRNTQQVPQERADSCFTVILSALLANLNWMHPPLRIYCQSNVISMRQIQPGQAGKNNE